MKTQHAVFFMCMMVALPALATADGGWHTDSVIYLRYTTNNVVEDDQTKLIHGLRMGAGFSADYAIIPQFLCPGLQGEIGTDPVTFLQALLNSDSNSRDNRIMRYVPIELSLRLYNRFCGGGFELRPFYGVLALTVAYESEDYVYDRYSKFTGRQFCGVELIWGYIGIEYSYFLPGRSTHFSSEGKTYFLMDKKGVSRFSLTIHLNPGS